MEESTLALRRSPGQMGGGCGRNNSGDERSVNRAGHGTCGAAAAAAAKSAVIFKQ